MKTGVEMTQDHLAEFMASMRRAVGRDVLVGIPGANNERDDRDKNGKKLPLDNATIGYIHEFGAPNANIPARPFLIPGIRSVQDKIAKRMGASMRAALSANPGESDRQLNLAGMTATAAIKNGIDDGIGPALSERTLYARTMRGGDIGAAAQRELDSRDAGNRPSMADAKPLVETGQLRNAITYVVIGGA